MKKILTKKSGWIRIIEAFTMILLITGFLLIIFSKDLVSRNNNSESVYEKIQETLRQVQLNNSLRSGVMESDSSSLPVEWEDFPLDLKSKVGNETPSYLNCIGKICGLNSDCVLDNNENPDKNLYIQKVIITSTLNSYSPRELKVFCWEK
tara:strand:+ start:687 stop:1136 length:450 start_codon:yes stop_codon:yes gene_type:complete